MGRVTAGGAVEIASEGGGRDSIGGTGLMAE